MKEISSERFEEEYHMTKDMTSGSTLRHIINFAVPLCMGMLFQQLYSMVDTMIVGKVLGVQPLAGVGRNRPPDTARR